MALEAAENENNHDMSLSDEGAPSDWEHLRLTLHLIGKGAGGDHFFNLRQICGHRFLSGGREGGASGEVATAGRGRALAAEMREEESVRLQHLLLAELGWTPIGTQRGGSVSAQREGS